ncbi:MAG TPA: outer membrane beta-barrel protein [Bacteroidales bacterium]|jgi:hypothetical protein|nr:outer membrane beta-barrel protein [Bacteroidales bacterium]HOS71727.1 outer membrane beta-barrel protein [Bacteroidales bacterium]HQH23079.1 outer membrane beta-barrel protein [Bacteroidales bacterium]HQK70198.1 outer membrane beta-barrel protein [Bacteroidales bacterium]
MKKYMILTVLVINLLPLAGQNKIGVSFNQIYSTFRFKNSEGEIEDLKYTIKYGYDIIWQYKILEVFFVEGSLSYNCKGASSTLGVQKLDWSLHYANAGVNAAYKMTIGRLSPHGGAGFYYGRLLKADQLIGSDYYNLMETNYIRKSDIGTNIFAGIAYDYSENGSVFIRLNEAVGLLQLEKNDLSSQRMFNRTFSIQVGLFFSIQ